MAVCLMLFLVALKLILTAAFLHERHGDMTPVRDDQQARYSAELRVWYLFIGPEILKIY